MAVGQGTPRELVATWVDMWNSYDLNQVEKLFLTDDRVSYFSSEFQGAIQGFESVLEHHEGFGFVAGGDDSRGTRLWVEDLTEDRFTDTAVLTGVWFFTRTDFPPEAGDPAEAVDAPDSGGGSPAAEADAPPQKGPVTFVCVLEEGGWRFAHMNFGNYLEAEEETEG